MGIGALFFLMVIAIATSSVGTHTKIESQTTKTTSLQAILAQTAQSGLHLAKEALLSDDDWSDCLGVNVNCADTDDNGFYPLYSPALEETMENYPFNKVTLSVLIKPKNRNRIEILSIAEKDNQRVALAARFDKVRGTSKVPIAYGGSSFYFYGGRLCSYYWDGTSLAGVTLPNMSTYLQDNFYWSPQIVVPESPAGPNPKDVRFYTNQDTEVRGYRVIDKLFSTGDVFLRFGAYVGYVSANGRIYKDRLSSCDTCLENQNWDYPNLSPNLDPLTFANPSGPNKTYNCHGQTINLPAGSYYRIRFRGNGVCRVKVVGGDEVRVRNLIVNRNTRVEVEPSDSEVTTIKATRVTLNRNSKLELKAQNGNAFILKAKRFSVYDNARAICDDPRFCLFDTNRTYNDGGTIEGVVLARQDAQAENGGTFIGNVIVEDADFYDATVCNIVDASGEQVLPQVGDFFSVVDPNGELTNPVVLQVWSTICSQNINDCIAEMEGS